MGRLRFYATAYLISLAVFVALAVTTFGARASESEPIVLAHVESAAVAKVPERMNPELSLGATVEDVIGLRGLPLEWDENVSSGKLLLRYATREGDARYLFKGGKLVGMVEHDTGR